MKIKYKQYFQDKKIYAIKKICRIYLAILNIANACMASDKQNDSVDRIVIAASINPISK